MIFHLRLSDVNKNNVGKFENEAMKIGRTTALLKGVPMPTKAHLVFFNIFCVHFETNFVTCYIQI